MQLDILAIGVHPDDIELSCSGTLLHYVGLNKKVGILDLTRGELGTRGNAKLRTEEAMEAAKIMGALVRVQLDMLDGFFEHEKENIIPIIEIIRKYKPTIVFANAIEDRHPDHGRAAKLIADSCFLSGLQKIETFDPQSGDVQEKWRPQVVMHYIQDFYFKPDFVFDITPYFEKKMEIIKTFKSQFYDPSSTEPESPISGKEFLEFVEGRARQFGRPAGIELAEGFHINRVFGVSDIFDII